MFQWHVATNVHIHQVTVYVTDLNSDSYMDLTFGGSGGHLGGSNGSHHQRTKRMRTSFKHHQLRTMKTYFTVNHNPDAKDLKQLSQKTGLAKRVLQVISFCNHPLYIIHISHRRKKIRISLCIIAVWTFAQIIRAKFTPICSHNS